MKVHIEIDEWYPVFEIDGRGKSAIIIEASEEQVARWRKSFLEFESIQQEMWALADQDPPAQIASI